ncbi:MAG: SDR family oxidoreductase [Pseudomonadota bacterium]|jgi:short-subunit dehydrogenase
MVAVPARVFITGASAGIGRALALHYAARGSRVCAIARNAGALETLAASHPGRIRVGIADVRDADAMRLQAEAFIAAEGVPDLVYANAGISVGTLTAEPEDAAVMAEVLNTNVLGLAHTFAPFIPAMRRRARGTLVGIASVAGLRGLPGAGAYSASKAAAIAYLEALRIEERAFGLKVVTLCPGYIDTAMTRANPYPMPFLIPVDRAARRLARAAEAGHRLALVPWPWAFVGRVMRVIPPWAWDRLLARAGRKPRRGTG